MVDATENEMKFPNQVQILAEAVFISKYIFILHLHHERDVTQGRFSSLKLVA